MNINAANLKVGLVAATDETRMNINTIHITPGYTEATDGHIAARVSLPEQYDPEDIPASCPTEKAEKLKPFSIPAKPAMKIKPACKKGYIPCLVDTIYVDVKATNANGHARFTSTDRETTIAPEIMKVDSEYPDIDRVFQKAKGKPSFRVMLNPALLRRLLEVAENICDNRYNGVQIFGYGEPSENKPIYIKAQNASGQIFKGLIMPMKQR